MSKKNSREECCLICGQSLAQDMSGFALFKVAGYPICGQCQASFIPASSKNVLYIYNDFFRSLLFRYKGLGDLALAPVFLAGHEKELQRKYADHVIVPAPSTEKENLARGFATLPWIFRSLQLPILPLLYKNQDYKQATSKHRENIHDVIAIRDGSLIAGKKVLLVDDVITSGHTLKACRNQLAIYQPLRIDVLVLAKRQEKNVTLLERIKGV